MGPSTLIVDTMSFAMSISVMYHWLTWFQSSLLVNADMHRLYDNGSWILIPEKRMVDAYKLGEEMPTFDVSVHSILFFSTLLNPSGKLLQLQASPILSLE